MPAQAGIQETQAWELDARLRGHDVLLVPNLRNRHLATVSAGATQQRTAESQIDVWEHSMFGGHEAR